MKETSFLPSDYERSLSNNKPKCPFEFFASRTFLPFPGLTFRGLCGRRAVGAVGRPLKEIITSNDTYHRYVGDNYFQFTVPLRLPRIPARVDLFLFLVELSKLWGFVARWDQRWVGRKTHFKFMRLRIVYQATSSKRLYLEVYLRALSK